MARCYPLFYRQWHPSGCWCSTRPPSALASRAPGAAGVGGTSLSLEVLGSSVRFGLLWTSKMEIPNPFFGLLWHWTCGSEDGVPACGTRTGTGAGTGTGAASSTTSGGGGRGGGDGAGGPSDTAGPSGTGSASAGTGTGTGAASAVGCLLGIAASAGFGASSALPPLLVSPLLVSLLLAPSRLLWHVPPRIPAVFSVLPWLGCHPTGTLGWRLCGRPPGFGCICP